MNIATRWAKTAVVLTAMLTLVGPPSLLALPINTPAHEAMILVNDYWIERHRNGGGLGPGNAVYHMGNLALYRTFCEPEAVSRLTEEKCDSYFAHTLNWANRHGWRLNTANKEADNQAAGQVYIALCKFEACGPTQELKAILDSINGVTANEPGYTDYHWQWIDAFFMAAPVFSHLGDLLGDAGYFDKMTALYTDTDPIHRGLPQNFYNEADDLWHRDKQFLPSRKLTQNGQKIYWSRGNGWVLAGLARVLEHLPLDYADRDLYVNMFRDMAASLQTRQRPDGFWNVSLGDPDDFAGREASGTALFTYALAWGMNNGILIQSDYRDVVRKAWEAMVRDAVQDNGKLGYVQRAADEPCDWMHSDQEGRSSFQEKCTWQERQEDYVSQLTDAYGIGAFLLAGSEVAKLATHSILQAEEADRVGGGSRVEANHSGYHGSGFVNFPLSGGFIEWTHVDGGSGGLATLSFRHALGAGGSRKVRLIVNGVKQDITFVLTGGWNSWQQLEVVVTLNPGTNNTIRLRTTGQDSANIDELLVQAHTP